MSGSYRDLVAWEKAMELVFAVYVLTKLGYIKQEEAARTMSQVSELARILNGLISSFAHA